MNDSIGATFSVEIRDPDHRVVSSAQYKSESFVKNFMLLMQAAFTDANVVVKKQDGTDLSTKGFSAAPTSYDTTDRGIVVGGGTAPVTAEDYALENEFQTDVVRYSPILISQPTAPVESGGVISNLMFSRSFTNVSNANIVINEIGIKVFSGGNGILIVRDVISPGIELPQGYTVTISYQFRTVL